MTVNKLRFLQRNNLEHEQRIQKEYFRDLIHAYGIDVKYFRKGLTFYDSPSGQANYTYGEDTTATYYLSGDMVVFMEMLGDAFLLSKFGIETDGDATIFFTIDDFNEKFRDNIGTSTSAVFSSNLNGSIVSGDGLLSGLTYNDDLTGTVSGMLTSLSSGYVSGIFNENINVADNPVNPDIKSPNYYDYGERSTTGTLSGIYSGTLDASGNGTLTGYVSGNIDYYIGPATLAGPSWDIAPQVGDFFRIDFEQDNNEEYEITRVHDRNLQTDGLNPLLGKYICRADCVRRDPSYETVIGDDQEEPDTVSKLDQNTYSDDISDEIFEYNNNTIDSIDGENSDNVYGSY